MDGAAHIVSISLKVLLVLGLIGINGFFVAAEFALVTVRWTRVEELFERGRFAPSPGNQQPGDGGRFFHVLHSVTNPRSPLAV